MDNFFAVPTAPTDTRRASLTDRGAGQAVMEYLLALQQDVPPRSAVSRALGVSPLNEERAACYRGALGEAAVGRLLEKLPGGGRSCTPSPSGKATPTSITSSCRWLDLMAHVDDWDAVGGGGGIADCGAAVGPAGRPAGTDRCEERP